MKCMRCGTIALFVALSSGVFVAPVRAAEQPRSASAPTVQSSHDLAREALSRWKATLKLTDAQVAPFESVMTDSYRKLAAARSAAKGDRTKLKQSVATIAMERDGALSKILTPEQMALYRANLSRNVSHAVKHVEKTDGKSK